jgi:hypothetical protein
MLISDTRTCRTAVQSYPYPRGSWIPFHRAVLPEHHSEAFRQVPIRDEGQT